MLTGWPSRCCGSGWGGPKIRHFHEAWTSACWPKCNCVCICASITHYILSLRSQGVIRSAYWPSAGNWSWSRWSGARSVSRLFFVNLVTGFSHLQCSVLKEIYCSSNPTQTSGAVDNFAAGPTQTTSRRTGFTTHTTTTSYSNYKFSFRKCRLPTSCERHKSCISGRNLLKPQAVSYSYHKLEGFLKWPPHDSNAFVGDLP